MQTPNGTMQMWFTGEYLEVVKNERLVYTESMSDDLGGRTKMVMTHVGIPSDSPGATGWTMAFDKLAAHLKAQSDR